MKKGLLFITGLFLVYSVASPMQPSDPSQRQEGEEVPSTEPVEHRGVAIREMLLEIQGRLQHLFALEALPDGLLPLMHQNMHETVESQIQNKNLQGDMLTIQSLLSRVPQSELMRVMTLLDKKSRERVFKAIPETYYQDCAGAYDTIDGAEEAREVMQQFSDQDDAVMIAQAEIIEQEKEILEQIQRCSSSAIMATGSSMRLDSLQTMESLLLSLPLRKLLEMQLQMVSLLLLLSAEALCEG